jgi:hypothetical protein
VSEKQLQPTFPILAAPFNMNDKGVYEKRPRTLPQRAEKQNCTGYKEANFSTECVLPTMFFPCRIYFLWRSTAPDEKDALRAEIEQK